MNRFNLLFIFATVLYYYMGHRPEVRWHPGGTRAALGRTVTQISTVDSTFVSVHLG